MNSTLSSSYTITCSRRECAHHRLNPPLLPEQKSFKPLNGSLVWLIILSFALVFFYLSHLQQSSTSATLEDLIVQIFSLRALKRFDRTVQFTRPPQIISRRASVVVFSDAGRKVDHDQTSIPTGLLFVEVHKKLRFHSVTCILYRSRRAVKSVKEVEIIGAGEAIEALCLDFSYLLPNHMDMIIAVESRDLFNSLFICRNSIDRLIRADVSMVRYKIESRNINRMLWISRKVNLAYYCTKQNSPLAQILFLFILNEKITLYFPDIESRNAKLWPVSSRHFLYTDK